jgi:ADP-ribosylglycohydrolase
MDLRNRFHGALLGLATGDAVGTAVEFQPPGTFPPVTDMTGGGVFGLRPGQWTDDTSMALCLAESLIARQGFDPVDQLDRYLRWWRDGHLSSTGACFDIGGIVSEALRRFERTGEPYCGPTDPDRAGNGSIMRLAPVPMAYFHRPAEALARCVESSRTTHQAPQTLDACRYFGGLILGALQGLPKETLLSPGFSPVAGALEETPLGPEVGAIAQGSFKHKQPPAIHGGGYVVDSLEAALWAFHHTDTFEAGCLMAVNLGHDADTTAAVYGQLAGAFYGLSGIPARWHERLALRDTLTSFADGLYEMATALAPSAGGR